MARNQVNTPEFREFEEKVVQVNRVSKKTKGGNNVGFSVLVVVGDKKGRVGVGLGKAPDVLSSIKKAIKKAKKKMISIPMKGTTIPFEITEKKGAAVVFLKPAPKGTGVIAGGAVRAVVEAAGIRDIVSKIMGSDNKASNVYATFAALKHIDKIVRIKGISIKASKEVTDTVIQPRPQKPRDQHNDRNRGKRDDRAAAPTTESKPEVKK